MRSRITSRPCQVSVLPPVAALAVRSTMIALRKKKKKKKKKLTR
jgi:hypothetical protein